MSLEKVTHILMNFFLYYHMKWDLINFKTKTKKKRWGRQWNLKKDGHLFCQQRLQLKKLCENLDVRLRKIINILQLYPCGCFQYPLSNADKLNWMCLKKSAVGLNKFIPWCPQLLLLEYFLIQRNPIILRIWFYFPQLFSLKELESFSTNFCLWLWPCQW